MLDFPNLYRTASLFGAGDIYRHYLELPGAGPLPLTIPHGVNTEITTYPIDIEDYAPIYVAWEEGIAVDAERYKIVLRFPHPWLLLLAERRRVSGHGTLFLGPPPSVDGFEQMLAAIESGQFPKPWGILLKPRGLVGCDYAWWKSHGFEVLSAGPMDGARFYYNLASILERFAVMAVPNISSAAIFAVALGLKTVPLPDVSLSLLVTAPHDTTIDLADLRGRIRQIWLNLFSEDRIVALAEARRLLGHEYLASKDELRARYEQAVSRIRHPVYIHEAGPRWIQFIASYLTLCGIPVRKVLPNPVAKLAGKIRYLRKTHYMDLLVGSDLSHYGIVGTSGKLRVSRKCANDLGAVADPGNAVRQASEVAASE